MIGPSVFHEEVLMKAQALLLAAFLFSSPVACTQGGAPPGDEATDAAAIRQVHEQRVTALNNGDRTAWLSVWAGDVRMIDPSGPDVVGIAALQAWADPFFDQLDMVSAESVNDLQVSGDWAFASLTYTFEMTPKAGGETVVDHGKGILVFQRAPNLEWKISRILFAPSPVEN
jgi:ketosteroid isomerase-like protein